MRIHTETDLRKHLILYFALFNLILKFQSTSKITVIERTLQFMAHTSKNSTSQKTSYIKLQLMTYPGSKCLLRFPGVHIIHNGSSDWARSGTPPYANQGNTSRKNLQASNNFFVKEAFQFFPIHLENNNTILHLNVEV